MKLTTDIKYLIIVGLLALIVRICGIEFGLPFLYNIDEAHTVNVAVKFGSGDLNPHTFVYPPFFSYILFFLYVCYYGIGYLFGIFSSLSDFKLTYFNDPTPFYVIGRLTAVIIGTLTVMVVYLSGKKAYNQKTGVIASLFFAFFAMHINYSRVIKPDIVMTFFILLSIYYICQISRHRFTIFYYILAGIFAGFAITTKPNAGLIILPIIVVFVMNSWENGRFNPSGINIKSIILCFVVMIVAFLAGNPFALLDFHSYYRDLQFQSLIVSETGNIFSGLFTYLKAVFLPQSLSQIGDYFGVVSLLGIGYAFCRHTKIDIVLLTYTIVHLLFTAYETSNFIQPRYLLPIMPICYLLGARFLIDMVDKLPCVQRKKDIIMSLVILILIFHPIKISAQMCYINCQTDTATIAREWIEQNIPANSKILYTERRNLMLTENEESLFRNFKLRQERIEQFSKFNIKFQEEKLKALSLHTGAKYYIFHLPEGWDRLTHERAVQFGKLPPGAVPQDLAKISLEYWMKEKIEYIIIFPELIKQYFTEDGKIKFVSHFEFYSELFKRGELIKQFIPEYPNRPGIAIEIYKL